MKRAPCIVLNSVISFERMKLAVKLCEINYSFRRQFGTEKNLKDNVISSTLPSFEVPKVSTNEMLWGNVGLWSDKVAIECAETRKLYTYKELLTNMKRFATTLRTKFRLDHGDVVSVVLPNMPEFPVVALGGVMAGCTVSTVNPTYTQYEFQHMFSLTHPKVIVTNNASFESVKAALATLQKEAKVVVVDRNNESIPSGTVRYTEVAEAGEVDERLLNGIPHDLEDLLLLPFSSGTTGLPKAVQISQKNVVCGLEMISQPDVCLPDPAIGSFQEVVPCLLPFFHVYGLIILLLGHLKNGCKLLTMTKFNMDVYLDVLKKEKASILYVVPPLAIFLGKSDLVTSEHLASARFLLSGAAPLAADDVQVLLQKAPHLEAIQAYGATETTSLCSTMSKGSTKDYGGVGFPLSNTDLRLVCPTTGSVLSPDQVGELEIRGPQVTAGYYKNEAANKDSFTADGFYRSGDLASFTPAGGLQIKDRLKELIKVKGLQVAPAELEGILRSHPSVLEAAVVGEPHDVCGEVPRAFVVLKSERDTPKEDALIEYAASKVASFKRIHRLQYVKELPKTTTGKILRRKLLEMYDS